MINLSKKEKSAVVFTKNNVFDAAEAYFCPKRGESYEVYCVYVVFLLFVISCVGTATFGNGSRDEAGGSGVGRRYGSL